MPDQSPAAGVVFGFTPAGHLVFPGGVAPAPVFFQVSDNTGDSKTHGFRVLNSGIICPASVQVGALCDEAQ